MSDLFDKMTSDLVNSITKIVIGAVIISAAIGVVVTILVIKVLPHIHIIFN